MATNYLRWLALPLMAGTLLLTVACGGGSDPEESDVPPDDTLAAETPTAVPTEPPVVTLSPDTAKCGVTFAIAGTGFAPYEAVAIIADPAGSATELAQVTTGREGEFEARLLGFSGTGCVPGSEVTIVARAISDSTPAAEVVFAVDGTPTPVPTKIPMPTPAPYVASTDTTVSTWVSGDDYVVRDGDTLWDIASAYGVSVDEIVDANRVSENTFLQPGETLTIPNGS